VPGPHSSGVLWLQVKGVTDANTIEQIGDLYNLHPLLLEDVMNTDQRPKVEDYGDHLFVVLRGLHFDTSTGLQQRQVSLVLGPNYVLSFEESEQERNFEGVENRLMDGRGRLLQEGADYLLYSLLDSVVDHYFAVLESVSDQIEMLEDEVLSGKEDLLPVIHRLKRELISLRKSIWPLREALVFLDRQHSSLIDEDLSVFFRDIYDHCIHIVDTIESFRDMLSGLLDVHLSSISTRLNQVMKLLTLITTIFMPMTLITGIYGMNFERMPFLHSQFGFPLVVGIMALISGSMIFFFRKKRWL
tara:strand:+ start:157447 stop:158349 length:903 start_codon:yes stop_codon:yes gene_type:complete